MHELKGKVMAKSEIFPILAGLGQSATKLMITMFNETYSSSDEIKYATLVMQQHWITFLFPLIFLFQLFFYFFKENQVINSAWCQESNSGVFPVLICLAMQKENNLCD